MITEIEGLDRAIKECKRITQAKTGDYGASWRRMRREGISDVIANKIDRVRHLEDLEREGKSPQVSEGIESDLIDIMNYATFYLIKLWEKNDPSIKLNLTQLNGLHSQVSETFPIQESLPSHHCS